VTGVTEDGYVQLVENMSSFLAGDHKPIQSQLQAEMRQAADVLEFERAAKLRDQLAAARKAMESQEMVLGRSDDLDVIGMEEDDLEAAFQVFFVRRGRMMGRRGWVVDKVEAIDAPQLMSSFLRELYMDREEVPPRVLAAVWPSEQKVLEQWLAQVRGTSVRISVPSRGDGRRLLQVANHNAKEAFARHKLRRASDFAARSRALSELGEVLGLPIAPLRIEAYDISNLGPSDKVGSMVVFEDGLPKRSDYRRFEIKGVPGQDDFASMDEVLRRRFARLVSDPAAESNGKRKRPGRFAYPPALIVVDGGRGQLSVAERVLSEHGLSIPAVGLAKRLEEVYLPGQPEPLQIARGSEALFVLQHIRDEAHRFAVTYHRGKRTKRALHSPLDDVPGVGEARKKALLRRFGSLARLRSASVEELEATPGVGPGLARTIYDRLHGVEPASERRPEPSAAGARGAG
ncbi:MAG TPA: excinuclease ABC subunit UvrC, partial [Actinomycetota bacterium]|nr:excinuclease ABC subunit UvrC [Actinomycetota bacterium]